MSNHSSDLGIQPKPVTPRPHRLMLNVVMLLTSAAITRYNCARLIALHLPDILSIKALLSAGGLTVLTTLVPSRSRMRALLAIRNALDSQLAMYTCLTLFIASMLPLGISVLSVRWTGPEEIAVHINGKDAHLRADDSTKLVRVASQYAPMGTVVKLTAGAFESDVRVWPFQHKSVTLPFYATSTQNPRLAQAEYRLLSTFFTLFDRQDLFDIQETLLNIKPSEAIDRNAIARLQRIRDIIDTSANSSATIDTKLALVDNFADNYPDDPWIPLLKAQARYGSSQFTECSELLVGVWPKSAVPSLEATRSTEQFLRGMCEMKAVVVAPRNPVSQRDALMHARDDMQSGVDRLLLGSGDHDLMETARISTSIYKAICEFYSGDMKEALRSFRAVAEITSSSQQARARNNAGFAAFVLADFPEARQEYTLAYEAQPKFTYIKANLAYLTLAEGGTSSARKAFTSIADDIDLQRTSPEDVLLSKIMLLELDDDDGVPLETVNTGYATILSAKKAATWEFEPNEDVRYARLIHEVVNKVYLGGDYFGLEMFALTTACRAREAAMEARNDAVDRQSAISSLQNDIQFLTGRVSPKWILMRHLGWFSHLTRCSLNPNGA
jgi:tetratricopeptide (TPR) repeat protein